MLHDMIRVDDMGQISYNELTQNRWHSSIKDFFTTIKRNSLRTGIKRKKNRKELYSMAVLKEGCQAFLPISNEDVFSHPITSVPLSAAILKESKCSQINAI